MTLRILPLEIENVVQDFKNGLDHSMHFQNKIKLPLQIKAIRKKYLFLEKEYDNWLEDMFDDNSYLEKFLKKHYINLEEDFKIVSNCKCCTRHQTNRPTDLYNSELNTYKQIFKEEGELIENDCKCVCRKLCRDLVRIVKTDDKFHHETTRNMFFFEASKRVNKARLACIEDYQYHCFLFPNILTDLEKDTPLRKKVDKMNEDLSQEVSEDDYLHDDE